MGVSAEVARDINPHADDDPGGFLRRAVGILAAELDASDRDRFRESFKARRVGLRAQLHDLAAFLDTRMAVVDHRALHGMIGDLA